MARNRNIAFLVFFGGALFLTLVAVAVYIAVLFVADDDVGFGDAVAVVDVQGEILYDLWKVQEIESHRDNDRVKAILIHINTPGGGVAASQAIYRATVSARERKPVVAFLGPLATSGGYYVACAADTIVAYEGTLTGSIGVIASFVHTEELFRKVGLGVTVIKAGKYKDVGSPHREMTDAERLYMGALLDNVYVQFLNAVSDGRRMPMAQVEELAEGRLYSGEEALALGLVDRIGTYEEALALAAAMGGIAPPPRVIRKRRKRPLAETLLGRVASNLPALAGERVQLQYIMP
ncbi:MAG: signal peptide peptidase SppA [Candidatus Krumholzibacteriia bacterium]